MSRVFLSTTNNIDNGKVITYHEVVSSHIVAGTGFLSDLAASFSDIFGGRSGSYRRQLESLYDEALDELSDKAKALGANGIVALRIDMDNISAKAMSMFMITAVGTAVTIKFDEELQSASKTGSITSSVLVGEVLRRNLLAEIKDESKKLSKETLDTIFANPSDDFIIPLSRRYYAMQSKPDEYTIDFQEKFNTVFPQLIPMVDKEKAAEGVYTGLTMNNSCYLAARRIIRECDLFDAKQILLLVNSGHVSEVACAISCEQPVYNESDLADMEALLQALDNLPDVGKIEFVSGRMFSKDGEKYICRNEHLNEPDVEFCEKCGENIKGLTKENIKAIEQLRQRVTVLRELLMK